MSESEQTPETSATLHGLLSLAWPIILARASQAVVGFCDALMVAPLGQEALAATATGATNIMAVMILPIGLATIVQSFTAQLHGRGDDQDIPRFAWYALAIAAGAGVLAVAGIPLINPALEWLGYDVGLRDALVTYLSIRLLSVLPGVATDALGAYFGGTGETRPAMLAGLVTMGLNIVLNFLLIEPHFGLPGYGVAGAAWASVIASWVGFGVVLTILLRRTRGQLLATLTKLQMSELKRVLRFGAPNGASWFLEFSAFTLFLDLIVAKLGTVELAAFNAIYQVNAIAFMPAFGVATAGGILVGQAIGGGSQSTVWPLLKLTCKVVGAWMGALALLYVVAPAMFLRPFTSGNQDDAAFLEAGALMLAISSLWQVFDAVGMTVGETLRAAGDTAWCMAARILLAWFVFVPLAWISVRELGGGVQAAMFSFVAYIAMIALALAARYASGKWRNIQLVPEPAI